MFNLIDGTGLMWGAGPVTTNTYLRPSTGFECPVAALIGMGIFSSGNNDLRITRKKRRRNRKNLGGRQSLRVDQAESVIFAIQEVTGTTHIHMGMYMENGNIGNVVELSFKQDGNANVSIVITITGHVEIHYQGSDGSVLATSVDPVPFDEWILLELEITAQATGGVRLWLNRSGTALVDTGVENCVGPGHLPDFNSMTVSTGLGCTVWLDDLLIADEDTGRSTNNWYVVGLRAGGPGVSEFTPVTDPANWQNVDDNAEAVNVNQFNAISSTGTDQYLLKNLPFKPNNILMMQTVALVTREGDTTGINFVVNSEGALETGDVHYPAAGATMGVITDMFQEDPNIAGEWERRSISRALVGVQIT